MNKYIGIDLHSNNSVVVVADEGDRIIYQKRLSNKLDEILIALAPHKDEAVGVVVESTYNWYPCRAAGTSSWGFAQEGKTHKATACLRAMRKQIVRRLDNGMYVVNYGNLNR